MRDACVRNDYINPTKPPANFIKCLLNGWVGCNVEGRDLNFTLWVTLTLNRENLLEASLSEPSGRSVSWLAQKVGVMFSSD